ncbi:MAG: hypothetical protein JWQ17_6515 [Tardiphaga sp.]|nr:hypothetical protein [Tardiphaga sp.]
MREHRTPGYRSAHPGYNRPTLDHGGSLSLELRQLLAGRGHFDFASLKRRRNLSKYTES